MMSPGAAVDFWERCYHQTPKVDPGFQGFMEWREIADKPADEDEAMGLIKGVIAGRIEGLGELIAVHEEIAGEERSSGRMRRRSTRGRRGAAAEVAGGEVAGAEADAGAVPEDAGGEGEAEDLHHGGHGGQEGTMPEITGTGEQGTKARCREPDGMGWSGAGTVEGRTGELTTEARRTRKGRRAAGLGTRREV